VGKSCSVLIDVLSGNLPVEAEKNHEKNSFMGNRCSSQLGNIMIKAKASNDFCEHGDDISFP
jgi:hypothetical protein